MSFLRSALTARTFARRFATAPPPKSSSNTGLWLTGAGVVGLAGYVYMDYAGKSAPAQQLTSPLDPENFKDFKLKKIIPYNHNTSKFIFELPDKQATLLPVASCIVVKSSDPEALKDANGKPIVRPYTPISPPDQKGEFTLMVKKYETGNASKYIHSLKEGDTLSVKGPFPKWPYKQNEFDEVVLIGGGSGITPLYQVVSHALNEKGNKTKFTLLYGNIKEEDILLRKEFDELKTKYPKNLELVYSIDEPTDKWTGPTGFIGADLIKKYADPSRNIKVFVCGPVAQVAAIAGKKAGMKQGELGGILKELGYTEEQVYKF